MTKTWVKRRPVRRPNSLSSSARSRVVGVQVALHHRIGAAFMDQFAGQKGGPGIGRFVDDFEARNVAADPFGGGADAGRIADQDRGDDAGIAGNQGAAQRFVFGRADDGGDQGGQGFGAGDQRFEMAVPLDDQAGDVDVLGHEFPGWGDDLRLARDDHACHRRGAAPRSAG
jgi:hypothetical protein